VFPLYDRNKSATTPLVTWALIAVNGLVFVWEAMEGFDLNLFWRFGEIPAQVLQGQQLYTLLTSMFLHADLFHLLGNMVYLFVFGDNIEDRYGHGKYLLLYLVFGVAGGLTHSVLTVLMGGSDMWIPAVGASAAISGVLGAYVVFFPRARIVSIVPSFIFVRVAPVPAWIFLGFWFVLQLLYSGAATSVAYLAHIGGFLTGVIVAKIFAPQSRVVRAPPFFSRRQAPRWEQPSCAYCGSPLTADAAFCPVCGRRRLT